MSRPTSGSYDEFSVFANPDRISMSANPTRVDRDATATTESVSPLQEGNRVLESIAQQEALRALLAFSNLHEQIQNRRLSRGSASERDLFETERFILDEVLQLICDRAQAVTQANGIMIALAEVPKADSTAERPEMVCRASAGPLAVERGVRLIGESEFLQDGLESGRILRCDDCEIDTRVELDFSRAIGARSSVLVPLRGRHEQVGVLQAFSTTPWAFSDHDIRCFDLFGELVLAALKPTDQDRRIDWLSNVAGEVLRSKAATAVVGDGASPVSTGELFADEAGALGADSLTALPTLDVDLALMAPFVNHVVNHAGASDLFEGGPADETLALEPSPFTLPTIPTEALRPARFLRRFSFPFSIAGGSRPGLNVVMGLLAVAALFSAGAWWGMQAHGRSAGAKVASANIESSVNLDSPQSVTVPPAPRVDAQSLSVSDNLMSSATAGSEEAPLVAVPEDKLAALPKITGVRHWSSSMGSTVVIDMEDQVPYEVHRLMSPERIYFDLHDTVLPAELAGKSMDVGDASLTRVRVAQPVAGVTRIVLDTKDGSNFSVSMESNPYRLVVELRDSTTALAANRAAPNHTAVAAKAAPVAALAANPIEQSLADKSLAKTISEKTFPARTGRFRIVLDAGHGGWDLGTVGRQGLLEKDLVLDVTQRLGKLLQARLGSEVMFTRSSDTYLPLDQRADFANQAQADLFVSVHANYSSSAAARGVETYYTNLFSAPGSREIEKHDDGTFAKLMPVSLTSSALHEKIAESQRLAASVQRSLYATLAASSPDIRNRGTKDSAFVVLTGTTMPAILTEISFVSSPADEHNLQSAAYRQQIAEALYKGIARYQESSPRSKVAQLQTTAARR
jgi:N-acetylmuramoyl-L-alanine amidase